MAPVTARWSWETTVNSCVDNWLVTNACVCSGPFPGDRRAALGCIRGLFFLFCSVLWSGNKDGGKNGVKETGSSFGPPPSLKSDPHNGTGDQSSSGERALHWSVCLSRQEAAPPVEEELPCAGKTAFFWTKISFLGPGSEQNHVKWLGFGERRNSGGACCYRAAACQGLMTLRHGRQQN